MSDTPSSPGGNGSESRRCARSLSERPKVVNRRQSGGAAKKNARVTAVRFPFPP
ncbi:hypothetical protein KCP74_13875 [Salmonella enterica subsp. enterica]|nr:hypothetical protein KCP74_13875 [Salmonella enterica subsp. enterica]